MDRSIESNAARIACGGSVLAIAFADMPREARCARPRTDAEERWRFAWLASGMDPPLA